jgi:hypothetical protein
MGLYDQFKAKTPLNWETLVSDCVKLINEQVAAKGGISGGAVKIAYSAIKGISPNYITEATGRILPDILTALDPIWHEGTESGNPASYLAQHGARTADAILSITDAKAAKTERAVVRGSYSKLRESVKKDLEAAVPRLAQIIDTQLKQP